MHLKFAGIMSHQQLNDIKRACLQHWNTLDPYPNPVLPTDSLDADWFVKLGTKMEPKQTSFKQIPAYLENKFPITYCAVNLKESS